MHYICLCICTSMSTTTLGAIRSICIVEMFVVVVSILKHQ